jgi:hypothetical protein
MDPITLFAMANAAVSAVKAGCKLYKDIKGAAGEVKVVLKDLDDQFSKLHSPEKPATVEQRNQYVRQKNEVIELNKKAESGQHTGVYQEIGDYLGQYYDNYYKCLAIFEEEERRADTEVYTGDASLGKRALQRVLMKKQLEQMGTELRQLMVYESPPELGALHTEVEEMMEKMGKQQKILIARQMQNEYADKLRKKRRLKKLKMEIALGFVAIMLASTFGLMIAYVVQDRIEKYPYLGEGWIPTTPKERRLDALPKRYTGR